MVDVKFFRLCESAKLPTQKTDGAAGYDLSASVPIVLYPGDVAACGTGLVVEIPTGHYAQVVPRSGLSVKGITVANSPGTIDADYRGEIKVILANTSPPGTAPYRIQAGDRIAQMILRECVPMEAVEVPSVDEMSWTVRGSGGLGSTGA